MAPTTDHPAINGQPAQPPTHGRDSRRPSRFPTIDEALPYLPLSSIIPFDGAIIPAPRLSSPTVTSASLLPLEQQSTATGLLRSLDREVEKAERASSQLEHTLVDLQKLFRHDQSSSLMFKPPRDPSHLDIPPLSFASDGQAPRLGSFAQMALSITDFAERYPALASPRANSHGSKTNTPSSSQKILSVVLPAKSSKSKQKASRPSAHSSATPAQSTTQSIPDTQAPSSQPSSIPKSIQIVAKSLTAEERAKYVPAVETYPHAPSSADQTKKSEAAVIAIQTLLSDIWQAESDHHAPFWTFVDIGNDPLPILQHDVQKQLDKLLATLIAARSTDLLPLEDILDLQKLSVKTLRTRVGLLIGDSWDDSAVQEWSSNLLIADQALLAGRTVLRTMTAGHEDKQIVSEECLGDLLDTITHVTDGGIVPIVELRFDSEHNSRFQIARANKSPILALFSSFTRAMTLLGTLLHTTDLDESLVTTVASLCRRIIFVENASSEKDSAIGVQTFEKPRKAAMDVLAKIFSRHVNQRKSIFVDILTSLEHLPVTRQSARQFRLPDAKPMQLVSALLMRLVQSSAVRNETDMPELAAVPDAAESDADRDSDASSEKHSDSDTTHRNRRVKKVRARGKIDSSEESLEKVLPPLLNGPSRDALYAVRYLVDRALKSSKSSDEPYRNLLDIFVEDFINVLGHPEWPAAELFLRHLTGKLYELLEGKHSAPAKAMALELLGITTSSVIDLQLQTRKSVKAVEGRDGVVSRLSALLDDNVTDRDMLSIDGPYRAVLESLSSRAESDAHTTTACGLHIVQWADRLLTSKDGSFDPNFISPEEVDSLKDRLATALSHGDGVAFDTDAVVVGQEEAKLSAAVITLRSQFCSWFNTVLNKILISMSSDQPSLRSKALKTVDQVLEKDPSLLDRNNIVLGNITKCLSDPSPQVKDSALGLLSKCFLLRRHLETQAYVQVAALANDPAIGVKKRALKLLKELYLRNDEVQLRSTVASAIIFRIDDDEEAICELARHSLEDIWIAPLQRAATADEEQDPQTKIKLRRQASILVGTIQQNPKIGPVLRNLLVDLMSSQNKNGTANISVCEELVLVMVDAIVSENDLPGHHQRPSIIQTLSIFAQARPQLFTSRQLRPLLPYLKNIKATDNPIMYRHTVIILRCTLPHMTNIPPALLEDTQGTLLQTLSRLPASELKEVTTCLWTLTGLLSNSIKLVTITRSALDKLAFITRSAAKDKPELTKSVPKLVLLVGYFVATFDLDQHITMFKDKFPDFRGDSLVALTLAMICPLIQSNWTMAIREGALETMCRICNAHPKRFMDRDVCDAIQLAFDSKEPRLEQTLLEGLRDFFGPVTDKKIVKTEGRKGQDLQAGTDRITSTYVATDRDGASTSLAQRFFENIKNIALLSSGRLALSSAQVIVAINQLGLMHPRESAPCLVALETSPVAEIADIAYQEHKSLFSRHESMYEKENMRAIQQAYIYQRDVVRHFPGFVGSPPVAKLRLFWDVIAGASAKTRKRFLTTICSKLDFEYVKLEMGLQLPDHLHFVRFCVENLALFDYSKVEDLMALVTGLERIVAATGTSFGQEIDGLAVTPAQAVIEGHTEPAVPMAEQTAMHMPDDGSIRRLAVASAILTLVWEARSHLYKLWSLAKHGGHVPSSTSVASAGAKGGRAGEGKTREIVRAPQRVPNSAQIIERYLLRNTEIMAGLSTRESQIAVCQAFQRIISIDDDVKVPVGDGDDDEGGRGSATPGLDDHSRSPSAAPNGTPGKRGRKRKSGADSQTGTPRKKRGAQFKKSGGRRRSSTAEDDDDEDFAG